MTYTYHKAMTYHIAYISESNNLPITKQWPNYHKTMTYLPQIVHSEAFSFHKGM